MTRYYYGSKWNNTASFANNGRSTDALQVLLPLKRGEAVWRGLQQYVALLLERPISLQRSTRIVSSKDEFLILLRQLQ